MNNQQSDVVEYLQEDEIDLRELWATLMKYKKKIAIFTVAVTLLALIYALSIPNSYKSTTLLVPQEQSGQSASGGLAALAGMAGVSLGGGSVDAGMGARVGAEVMAGVGAEVIAGIASNRNTKL